MPQAIASSKHISKPPLAAKPKMLDRESRDPGNALPNQLNLNTTETSHTLSPKPLIWGPKQLPIPFWGSYYNHSTMGTKTLRPLHHRALLVAFMVTLKDPFKGSNPILMIKAPILPKHLAPSTMSSGRAPCSRSPPADGAGVGPKQPRYYCGA